MGTGSSKTITRKPSVKIKRRFSLKRRSSIKEPPFRPRYTKREEPGIRASTVVDDQPELTYKPEDKQDAEAKPMLEPKPQTDIDQEIQPDIEPRSMPRPKPKAIEKVVEDNMDLFIEQSTRRRSLSDGQLPVSLQQLRADAQGHGHTQGHGNNSEGHTIVAIPANDLSHVTRVGYLERKINSEWCSSWFVLQDNTLYQYGQPIDDMTQDVIQLPGYEVIPCMPAGNRYMFQLIHRDGVSLELGTDCTADCDLWMEQMHVATQRLTLESLSLDTTNSLEQEDARVARRQLEDEARRQWQHELLLLKKQQLLREVLQQKEQLTRRQVKLAKSKQASSFEGSLPGSPQDDDAILFETDDQLLRDRTILKQRKVSMQLRVDMVQKQLQSSTTPAKPKRKFMRRRADKSGLPGASAVISPDHEQLEGELKKLNAELEKLNMQLEQMERRSGSSGHLSSTCSVGTSGRRRAEFALSSSASTESATSSMRDRSQSDFSESRLNRSFASDPNLLRPNLVDNRLSLRLDSVFSPDGVNLPFSGEVEEYRGKPYTKSDIPMIDRTPSPNDHPACECHQSWDVNTPTSLFRHPSPEPFFSSTGGATPCSMNTMAGLNKSCDFSLLQCQSASGNSHRGLVHTSSGGYGPPSQRAVPRSHSESYNVSKNEIIATALAEIAAFEELVQKKMHPSTAQQ